LILKQIFPDDDQRKVETCNEHVSEYEENDPKTTNVSRNML
jgi:hypothetical protein